MTQNMIANLSADQKARLMPWIEPVTLSGTHATLVPLSHDHAGDLRVIVATDQLDKLWYTTVPSPDGMSAEIDRRLALQAGGSMIPFTVMNAEGQVVGMTTYMNVQAAHRRVEIGSTWYARSVQRTGLNTQAKRLLLAHAFDALNCNCVEFRTHAMNQQSRAAIARLGAHFDGVLRGDMILANGTIRDTAVYSILAHEWPVVRAHLDWQLEKSRD